MNESWAYIQFASPSLFDRDSDKVSETATRVKKGPCQQLIFRDVWETACLQHARTIDDRENFTSVRVAAAA